MRAWYLRGGSSQLLCKVISYHESLLSGTFLPYSQLH